MNNKNISMIVAVAQNNAIGYDNKLLYWLPDDLKRFKALTSGHTIVMGRKTFESLPKGALPNRRNIVLTRNRNLSFENTEVYNSLEEALTNCDGNEEIFIIGGESLYKEGMSLANKIYLTAIDDTPEKADAFFPEISEKDWSIDSRSIHEKDEKHAFKFEFIDYIRKKEV